MKNSLKALMSLSLILVLLLTCLPAMAEEAELEPAVISGGVTMEGAVAIHPNLLGYPMSVVIENQPIWLSFTAQTSGRHSFHYEMAVKKDAAFFGGSWQSNHLIVNAYDADGKPLSGCTDIHVHNVTILINIDLEAGETIYINLARNVTTMHTPVSMSICNDAHHLPAEESHLTVPVGCCLDGQRAYLCQLCSQTCYPTVIPAYGHTLGDWGYYPEATCATPGAFGQLCTDCGEVVNAVELPALGHVHSDPVVVLEPTDRQPGLMVVSCTECGETISTTVIPAVTE